MYLQIDIFETQVNAFALVSWMFDGIAFSE